VSVPAALRTGLTLCRGKHESEEAKYDVDKISELVRYQKIDSRGDTDTSIGTISRQECWVLVVETTNE
jgi:hypothetical protein